MSPARSLEANSCRSEFFDAFQSPELVDPCERPLDDPSVLSKVAAAFDASPCDAGRDGAGAQVAAAVEVVALCLREAWRAVCGAGRVSGERMDRDSSSDRMVTGPKLRWAKNNQNSCEIALHQPVSTRFQIH